MINPEEIYKRLIQMGEEWSDLNSAADLLEEGKKSLMSEISLQFDCKSATERETRALASKEYKDYIKIMVEARRLANRAKVKYDSGKSWQENMRTAESTRRAEINLR